MIHKIITHERDRRKLSCRAFQRILPPFMRFSWLRFQPSNNAISRFQFRLTLWYVGTFVVMLLLIAGVILYARATQERGALDRSVRAAVTEIEAAVRISPTPPLPPYKAINSAAMMGRIVDDLDIPDHRLYLFDANGTTLTRRKTKRWIRQTIAIAQRQGEASRTIQADHGKTIQCYARVFIAPDGQRYIAAATADRDELGEYYAKLVLSLVWPALLTLSLVTICGYILSRKAAAPVIQSMDRMRRFMADAAHELRTPVSVLRATADVALQNRRTFDEVRTMMGNVAAEAMRMGDIVDDLLILAQADTGGRDVRREALYLDDLVADVVGSVRVLAEQKGITLDLARYAEAPVIGDATLLRRLVVILLHNAIEYTPTGGDVIVSVGPDTGRTVLTVTDTGVGIPPEHVPHIFNRFYRADARRTRTSGAGLGLAIAQWIATIHDAKINVHSIVGQGTTITVYFASA